MLDNNNLNKHNIKLDEMNMKFGGMFIKWKHLELSCLEITTVSDGYRSLSAWLDECTLSGSFPLLTDFPNRKILMANLVIIMHFLEHGYKT